MADKVAASMTIHDIPNMTKRGRKAIADWMIHLAKTIQKEPEAFDRTFRARYWYKGKNE